MSQVELFDLVRSTNAQYATLFGQIISMNFAMILAIFYFLHNAKLPMKIAAFVVYMVGMLMFVGLMLQEANFKGLAVTAMEAIPLDQRISEVEGYLQLRVQWLFVLTTVLLNAALWILTVCVVFLLFVWKKPRAEAVR